MGRTDLDVHGEAGARGAAAAAGEEHGGGASAAGGGEGGAELAEVGEVVVPVVGEAELKDLAADVVGEHVPAVFGGGGRGLIVASNGGGGREAAAVVGKAGDGVGVVVDADEDAVGGVGGAGARAEAERGEVAGLAVAASAHGGNGGGGVGAKATQPLASAGEALCYAANPRGRSTGRAVITDIFLVGRALIFSHMAVWGYIVRQFYFLGKCL